MIWHRAHIQSRTGRILPLLNERRLLRPLPKLPHELLDLRSSRVPLKKGLYRKAR